MIAVSEDEVWRHAVALFKKQWSRLRRPEYELPADSQIESTLRQIVDLIKKEGL
jgi:hypothetical protein